MSRLRSENIPEDIFLGQPDIYISRQIACAGEGIASFLPAAFVFSQCLVASFKRYSNPLTALGARRKLLTLHHCNFPWMFNVVYYRVNTGRLTNISSSWHEPSSVEMSSGYSIFGFADGRSVLGFYRYYKLPFMAGLERSQHETLNSHGRASASTIFLLSLVVSCHDLRKSS